MPNYYIDLAWTDNNQEVLVPLNLQFKKYRQSKISDISSQNFFACYVKI